MDFPPLNVLPEKENIAAGRGIDAGDQVEQSGLACAIGADDAVDLVLLHLDIDILGRMDSAEVLTNVHQLQGIGVVSHTSSPFPLERRQLTSFLHVFCIPCRVSSFVPKSPEGRKVITNMTSSA